MRSASRRDNVFEGEDEDEDEGWGDDDGTPLAAAGMTGSCA